MNVYYSTPFSIEKNLGKAYNHEMERLPNDDDWMCFTDADTQFLTWDYGLQIHNIISKNPDVGIFTCLCNRIGNKCQRYNGKVSEDGNICNHRGLALKIQEENYLEIKYVNKTISGFCMIVQKKTWNKIKFKERGLLRVDNEFSSSILKSGKKIAVMTGVYMFHYYRLNEGLAYKGHLELDKGEIMKLKDPHPKMLRGEGIGVKKSSFKEDFVPNVMSIEEVKEYFNKYYTEYYHKQHKFTTTLQIIDRAIHILKSSNVKNILEVGCGIGNFAKVVRKGVFDYIGFDLSNQAIYYANNVVSHTRFSIDNAETSNHFNGEYKAVVCLDTLQYIDNDLQVINNIKKNTLFIFTLCDSVNYMGFRVFTSKEDIQERYGKILNIISIEEVYVKNKIVYVINSIKNENISDINSI